ncbi:uncharacterized protein LOC113093692 [Carassius auratus]|uniref:Uncharacterized protein LOC113093692 n=1 Tax=Carassius auratus TaxID=7957 RepID=A0A6P6P236_CARAU|nr:uncharacterized protein LOC113093692 [Carassius auratus]
MRRFVYLLLFIFAPGNTLLNLRQGCGEKIIGERSGSIRYSLHPNRLLFNRITSDSTEKLLDITCTWIIDAHKNQTFWIDVISVEEGAHIGIKFGDGNTLTYEREERAQFSGTGRTIIELSLRRTDETFATLHLRWNTSEDSHTLALIPYTRSHAVSPSPNVSNDVTYTPDIPVSSNAAPKTHSLRGESIQHSGGVSDLDDKNRPLFPQEISNNGKETAGAWISDLPLTGTHSYSDTQTSSALDTHVNTLAMLSTEPFLAQSSTEIQLPLLSVQTAPRQATDVAATSAILATNDVAHTELDRGSSHNMHTHAHKLHKINSKTSQRGDPSSLFRTSSFMTVNSHYIQPFNETSKQKYFLRDSSHKAKATTVMAPNKDVLTISENNWTSQSDSVFWISSTSSDDKQPISSETDRTDRSPRSINPDQNITDQTIYDDSVLTTSAPTTVSKFPDVNQTNTLAISDSDLAEYSGYSTSPSEPPINVTSENEPATSDEFMHTSRNTLATPTITSLEASTTHLSHTIQIQQDTSTQEISSASLSISYRTSHNNNKTSAFTTFPNTIPPDLTPTKSPSTPEGDKGLLPSESYCLGLACTPYLPSTVRGKQEIPITSSPSISLSSPQMSPNVTSDLMVEDSTTLRFENRTDLKESGVSPSQVQNTNTKSSLHTESPIYTSTPQYSPPSSENTQSNVGFSDISDIVEISSGRSYLSPTQTSATRSEMTIGLSPFNDIHTGSTEISNGFTAHTTVTLRTSSDITTPYISKASTADGGIQTSTSISMTTPHWKSSQTSVVLPPSITTQQMNPHATLFQVQTHFPVHKPSTIRPAQHMTTRSYHIQTKAHIVSTQGVTQTTWIHSTASSFDRKWPHGRHYFIVKDQPATIKEKTFQVLLQIVLERDYVPSMRLHEVETFLQILSGFQYQHVNWHSGPVLQTVVQFQTVEALSWLGRVESMLQQAGLNPLPKKGIFVGGVRVKNITVGGLQTDVCEWLFECLSGFQCVSSKGNATCTSVCHSEYCKHQGICVHRLGQKPVCQCPVGEDYWFMGQRCDFRMTRLRLVGVCFGVLVAVAAVMALLSYLTVRRFKTMLMQAKVEQTRSSYRRFNHFDELSARFWGRSWTGSQDSLDNPAYTRSDELLHLRALDRTCCYHDDTLSVVSTYHGSGTHLNTIYPHGSQYGWDLSNCSLADGVVDSGKASDLSVCSWPIEPIQWTPFPLLQQLNRNTTTVKVSRPRSYCEGMELVDLEKSWTA